MRRYSRDELERLGRVDRWWMIMIYVIALMQWAGQVDPWLAVLIVVMTMGMYIGFAARDDIKFHRTFARYSIATAYVFMIATIDNYNAGLLFK